MHLTSVISYEEFERLQYETTVSLQLKEAEVEAASTMQRYTHGEVMESFRARLKETMGTKDV